MGKNDPETKETTREHRRGRDLPPPQAGDHPDGRHGSAALRPLRTESHRGPVARLSGPGAPGPHREAISSSPPSATAAAAAGKP